jgi:hypothetical protein
MCGARGRTWRRRIESAASRNDLGRSAADVLRGASMIRSYFRQAAAATLWCGLALASSDAFGRQDPQTTVTIDGVHYTLPAYVENRKIEPMNPLCYDYEYFYMLIKDRELFINGVSKYRAKPGDKVVVTYIEGVRVNGRQPPPQHRKNLAGARPCSASNRQ